MAFHGPAWTLIWWPTFKFDIFPLRKDEYSQAQFQRRRFTEIKCAFASAEDTILNKLRWSWAGGEVSERQWNDLLGILETSGGQPDLDYLNTWAPRLGVADLLERLLRASGA